MTSNRPLLDPAAVAIVAVIGCIAFESINGYATFGTPAVRATFVRGETGVYYKQGRVNRVFYRYRARGGTLPADERVGDAVYARVGRGLPFTVRLFAIGNWRADRIERTPAEWLSEQWDGGWGLCFLAFSAAAAFAVAAAVVAVATLPVAAVARLVRQT